ncbi:MAG: NAD(P)H-binding protein, partial [Actinobacteria bacterium]|nr:NAD(P)H-binding protein [Actinomycetota bacterium]
MALVLVTGGTGTLGRLLVTRLDDAGHDVRILSRRPGPGPERPRRAGSTGPERALRAGSTGRLFQGDLRTGEGLDAAVAGVDVIAHCASSPLRQTDETDVEGTRRLIAAVTAQAGGALPHLVYVSIVGVDRNPFPYYRRKLQTERVVTESGLPWTILRATQFCELLDYTFTAMRVALFALGGVRFQLLDAGECATRMAELVDGPPAGRAADLGGPEVRTMADLARVYRRARGWRRPVVPVPAFGKSAAAFKGGANLCPDNAEGRTTWEQW